MRDRDRYARILGVEKPWNVIDGVFDREVGKVEIFLEHGRSKKNKGVRDRSGEVLFIDTRKMERMVDRTHKELTDDDIAKIASTYHVWRGEKEVGAYEDVPGFCKSATQAEIQKHGHVLTPGRYVGAEEVEDNGEPFDETMTRLVAQLEDQFAEDARLEKAIRKNLRGLGYGGRSLG